MFGFKKEFESLKRRVEELEEDKEYQIKELIVKSNYSIAVMETLNRIIKYSKDGEPTCNFKSVINASQIYFYINKEEYVLEFKELREYYLENATIDRLILSNNLAYLTVTCVKGNDTSKTYKFIIDYKNQKYILDEVVENQKTYNIDDVELPCT